jgi:hypothetical protein
MATQLPSEGPAVRRPVLFIAACLALSGANATAGPAGRIEMDVLDLDEPPSQAVRRMDDAQRRAAAQRRSPAEHPSFGAYLPDESLGERGLAVPVTIDATESLRDFDGGRGHDKDHDKDDDKKPGGG